MNNELKCPVCQNVLRKLFNRYTGEPNCDYECGNFDCDLYGIEIPESVWKAVIQKLEDLKTISAKYAQSQKSVEIARKALESTYARGFTKSEAVGILQRNNMTISKTLEQIENKG